MRRFAFLRKLLVIGLVVILLACAEALPAVMRPLLRERRKAVPDLTDEPSSPGAPEPFIIKPQPTPNVPAAYKPQPKPQPKPRPGAKATPSPGGPAPTPPITRPT